MHPRSNFRTDRLQLKDVVWLRSGGESKRTIVGFLVVVVIIIGGRKVDAGATLEGCVEGGYDGCASRKQVSNV